MMEEMRNASPKQGGAEGKKKRLKWDQRNIIILVMCIASVVL